MVLVREFAAKVDSFYRKLHAKASKAVAPSTDAVSLPPTPYFVTNRFIVSYHYVDVACRVRPSLCRSRDTLTDKLDLLNCKYPLSLFAVCTNVL